MSKNIWILVGVVGLLAGCGDDGRGPRTEESFGRDDGGAPMSGSDGSVAELGDGAADAGEDFGPGACRSTAECDDGISCTEDTCRFPRECDEGEDCIGFCRHEPVPARCGAGQTCDVRYGCVTGEACNADDMCESDDACMVVEGCDPAARVCVVVPLDGDGDGNRPRVCGGTDCDDSRDDVFWGAAEACNGRDDDCDGLVDEDPDASDACGGGASCVEGACQCEDAGLELCADGVCVDTGTDRDHCGSCWRSCADDANCTDGVCTSCGREGQACCEADTACFGHTTCNAGTCEPRECTGTFDRLEPHLLPRCSVDTYECLDTGGAVADCLEADSTPPEGGVDCEGCFWHQVEACMGARCAARWADFRCCFADHCTEGDTECRDAECGVELDDLWSCARSAGCWNLGDTYVSGCFPL